MNIKQLQKVLCRLQQKNELKRQLQKGIEDIAQGRYTTYSSAQDVASQIKLLGRQQKSIEL